jgi:YbgC/YbaW family acyl-CoA thioester hydrolase
MGIVHHAVYPIWYEIARMDFFLQTGFSYSEMNSIGVNPAMVDLHLQYRAPATYPQSLYISTRRGRSRRKSSSFCTRYTIWAAENPWYGAHLSYLTGPAVNPSIWRKSSARL